MQNMLISRSLLEAGRMKTDITVMDFNDASPQGSDGLPGSRPTIDTEAVKASLLGRIEDVLSFLLPAGKIQHGKFHIGDVQGSPGDSMEVELTGDKAGVWFDHATGEGGDIFNLWASTKGLDTTTQFPQVMEDIQVWLDEPTQSTRKLSPSPRRQEPPMDELGPSTGKWDYHNQDGSLLACIYRYDPPGKKKEFRPWNVKTRKWKAPLNNRPLYNLPGIVGAKVVVLVEGEKAAEALINNGIAATTSMHGSNGPIEKTDWSPLAKKYVTIWPDKDKTGWDYAEAVANACRTAGASEVSILIPPDDKPTKWDAADAVTEGVNILSFLASVKRQEPPKKKRRINLNDWTYDRYKGPPPKRKWLIDNILPLGVPGMVAAIGGAGKSMLLMDLAIKVALTETDSPIPMEALGGPLIPIAGTAVIFTAEDDEEEVHRRLDALVPQEPDPDKLIVVPLPNAGGAMPLVGVGRDGPYFTDEYHELRESLSEIPDLRLVVFDPLQNFAGGDINSDPAVGSMFFAGMGRIAAETKATTLVSHHFRKSGGKPITTANEARESIRGTTALVDGGRWSYALWDMEPDEARKVCKQIGQRYERDTAYRSAVVKSNWPVDKGLRVFIRSLSTGLLIDRTVDIQLADDEHPELLDDLVAQVAKSAKNGQPFTRTGGNGLYDRRSELSKEMSIFSKRRLADMTDILLESGKVVLCMAGGSKVKKWLDIPEGEFALGNGDFKEGSGPKGGQNEIL
jgi:hypothetical protein